MDPLNHRHHHHQTYTPTIVDDPLSASCPVDRKSPQVGFIKTQMPLKALSEWGGRGDREEGERWVKVCGSHKLGEENGLD